MSNPLVSIIVPVYNAEKTVTRCLESICGQTYPELEILVLNDGSADDSLTVCQQFASKDPRIRVVDKPNTGVSDTRNRGLDLAHGKYIQFVDSDDCILPEYTEKLVLASENAQAELAVSPFWLIYPAGFQENPRWWEKCIEPILKRNEPISSSYGFLQAGVYTQAAYARSLIQTPFAFYYSAIWNKLYLRERIEQNHIRFPLHGYSEDLTFNALYLSEIRTAAVIEYAGYGYIQNAQSLCHSTISNFDMVFLRFRTMHDYGASFHRMGMYRQYCFRIWLSVFSENEFTLKSLLPAEPVPELFRCIENL